MRNRFLTIVLTAVIIVIGSSLVYASEMADIQAAIIAQEYEKANRLAKEYLSQNPQQGMEEATYYYGLSFLHLSDYVQARKYLKQVVQSRNNKDLRDQAYIALFNAYYLGGDYQESLRVIHKAIKTNPESQYLSGFYLKLARAYLKLAQWKKAKEYLEKIINDFPQSLEVAIAKQLLEEKQAYSVQVGAFVDRLRAESLMLELKEKSEYAYIVETKDADDTVFYRVRVGQVTKLDEATHLESKLAQAGYPTQIYP